MLFFCLAGLRTDHHAQVDRWHTLASKLIDQPIDLAA